MVPSVVGTIQDGHWSGEGEGEAPTSLHSCARALEPSRQRMCRKVLTLVQPAWEAQEEEQEGGVSGQTGANGSTISHSEGSSESSASPPEPRSSCFQYFRSLVRTCLHCRERPVAQEHICPTCTVAGYCSEACLTAHGDSHKAVCGTCADEGSCEAMMNLLQVLTGRVQPGERELKRLRGVAHNTSLRNALLSLAPSFFPPDEAFFGRVRVKDCLVALRGGRSWDYLRLPPRPPAATASGDSAVQASGDGGRKG